MRGIHDAAGPLLDRLFVASHYLGKTWSWIGVVLVSIGVHLARRRLRAASVWLGLGLSAFALVFGLKALVARPRPELWDRLIGTSGFSFPSGHALASATFLLLVAFEVRAVSARAGLAAIVLAVLGLLYIGLGRIYLGVHWPTDVLAGWGIGTVLALLAARLLHPTQETRTPT